MIKYFCDGCGKEIKIDNTYEIAMKYEYLPKYKGIPNRNVHRMFCKECNDKVTEKLEDVLKFIRSLS